MELVERQTELDRLRLALQAAHEHGRVALVAGEAGIGKTSLLRSLAATHDAVWWGACDALQTPHPLAPLLDIARETRPRFATALAGPRAALFEAVLDGLRDTATPVLMVIEDANWADDATLDLLKFLGRRIERTKALLVVSFRDDEVGSAHPLRRVIGELPQAALLRVELPRLTQAGVEALARAALRSSAGLFAATQGNPFFVTELLRHPVDKLPRTVQDLVLARYARLDAPAQAIVRLASVVPGQVERWLVDELLSPAMSDLEACLDSGLLLADAATLRFRHELARVAVESSLPSPVTQALHAQVLHALTAVGRSLAAARLAHHAALGADASAIRRYAAAAAEDARERGAHHEAARHCRMALQHADASIADGERARWLESLAEACRATDEHRDAVAAREQLDAIYLNLGDLAQRALNLSRLAGLHVAMGHNAEADAMSLHAIAMIETLPPSSATIGCYGIEASLRMLDRDCAESVRWSEKAIRLAHQLGDRARICAGLVNLGAALLFIDYGRGCAQLEEGLQLALADGHIAVAALALGHLGSGSGELMRLHPALVWLRRALAFASEHEQDGYAHYAAAWLALCEGLEGRWTESTRRAGELLERTDTVAITRVMALVALGRIRLRRGDPGLPALLAEAQELAEGTQTLQRIAPVRALRAEAAWDRGDAPGTAAEARAALPLALRQRHPWFIGELAFWCWRAGALHEPPPDCAEPYALQITGHWREAAAAWATIGCPFEQARALADGDEAAQREALAILERLGARPAAEALRRRLHDAGVRGLARGPRTATRDNAFGLTAREFEVLRLLCEGLRNAEIAARLHRSVRTVDHHLAAVFAKLGVDSRSAAITTAQREGLAPQSGQARNAK